MCIYIYIDVGCFFCEQSNRVPQWHLFRESFLRNLGETCVRQEISWHLQMLGQQETGFFILVWRQQKMATVGKISTNGSIPVTSHQHPCDFMNCFFSSDCFWIVWKLEISTCLDSLKKATFVVWPIVPRMIFRETFCWSISWPFEPLQETRCSFRTFAFSEDGSTHNGRQQDESFMVIIACKLEVYPWFYRWFTHVLPMVYSFLHNFHHCRC